MTEKCTVAARRGKTMGSFVFNGWNEERRGARRPAGGRDFNRLQFFFKCLQACAISVTVYFSFVRLSPRMKTKKKKKRKKEWKSTSSIRRSSDLYYNVENGYKMRNNHEIKERTRSYGVLPYLNSLRYAVYVRGKKLKSRGPPENGGIFQILRIFPLFPPFSTFFLILTFFRIFKKKGNFSNFFSHRNEGLGDSWAPPWKSTRNESLFGR